MKNKENRTCEINEWNIGKLEIRSDCLVTLILFIHLS